MTQKNKTLIPDSIHMTNGNLDRIKRMPSTDHNERLSPYPLAAPLPEQDTHNLILDRCRDIPFYTDMTRIMNILGWDDCRHYSWLVNDIDGDWEAALPDPYACSGAELARVLAEHPHEQYIWAVFSAFASDIAPQQIDLRTLPDAESADFWQDNPKPQHPQALFEIVCWDSTCTLFIGLPDKLARRLVAAFPDCRRLQDL